MGMQVIFARRMLENGDCRCVSACNDASQTLSTAHAHLEGEGVFAAQRVAQALDRGHRRQVHCREQLLVGRRMVRSLWSASIGVSRQRPGICYSGS